MRRGILGQLGPRRLVSAAVPHFEAPGFELVDPVVWISPIVGLLVAGLFTWTKKASLPIYNRLREQAASSRPDSWLLFVLATAHQGIVVIGLLMYPWFLEWHFGARGFFDFVPGYNLCLGLYLGAALIAMFGVHYWLGVSLDWFPRDSRKSFSDD